MRVRHGLSFGAIVAVTVLFAGAAALSAFAEEARPANGSVSGKVINKDGDPVKSAMVYVFPDTRHGKDATLKGGDRTPRTLGGGWPSLESAIAKGAVVDGSYKINDVPPGKYMLAAVCGNARMRGYVVVNAGAETKADDIKLTVK